MATFNLEESLARRLRAWAARQHRSPEEILTEWVEERLSADEQVPNAEPTPNPLLKMAQRAEELGLSSGRSDISERSRKILNEEYPRHLKARMDRNETDTD